MLTTHIAQLFSINFGRDVISPLCRKFEFCVTDVVIIKSIILGPIEFLSNLMAALSLLFLTIIACATVFKLTEPPETVSYRVSIM